MIEFKKVYLNEKVYLFIIFDCYIDGESMQAIKKRVKEGTDFDNVFVARV